MCPAKGALSKISIAALSYFLSLPVLGAQEKGSGDLHRNGERQRCFRDPQSVGLSAGTLANSWQLRPLVSDP